MIICSISFNSPVMAKQSTKANPWGYTGLINMPTADVADLGEFELTTAYLFKNSAFTGNLHAGIFNRFELGIVGGSPLIGFSGLAGNLKYQLISPTEKAPTSLAVGANMIGLAKDTVITNGNYLYMVLSHDFNWKMKDNSIYNLLSGHIGFSGNLDGARLMTGLDIPVTDYINLEGEYLGKIGTFTDSINFGIKGKPLPYITVSFLTLGTSSTKGFADTEYMITLSFNSKIPAFQQENLQPKIISPVKPEVERKPENKISKPEPKPTPKPQPTSKPEPTSTPKPQPSPKEEPSVIPKVPEVKPTPVPIPSSKETADPDFGVLKGKITTTTGSSGLDKALINLKGLVGKYTTKTYTDSEGTFKFIQIPKGEYILVIEKDGYQESRRQLLIRPGNITEANIELVAVSGSISGRIFDINNNPVVDLTIVVDNDKKSTTNKEGKYNFSGLKPGSHLLSIRKNEQEIKSIDIDIIAGTELNREIVLEGDKPENKTPTVKRKSSAVTGKITDNSGPIKGARVMFEGDKLTVMTISGPDGKYTVRNIPPGGYKMTVSKVGYTSRAFSVKIKENQDARHDVKLQSEVR